MIDVWSSKKKKKKKKEGCCIAVGWERWREEISEEECE
jgi:hypothetical protein